MMHKQQSNEKEGSRQKEKVAGPTEKTKTIILIMAICISVYQKLICNTSSHACLEYNAICSFQKYFLDYSGRVKQGSNGLVTVPIGTLLQFSF